MGQRLCSTCGAAAVNAQQSDSDDGGLQCMITSGNSRRNAVSGTHVRDDAQQVAEEMLAT
jgi:hypothetical protein